MFQQIALFHCIYDEIVFHQASLVAQMVKNPPAMWEIWVQSLGWEDPLEEDIATHSSILAWRIPMDRGAWRATIHGVAKNQIQLSNSAQHSISSYTCNTFSLSIHHKWTFRLLLCSWLL